MSGWNRRLSGGCWVGVAVVVVAVNSDSTAPHSFTCS